jgi:hypothetical protein
MRFSICYELLNRQPESAVQVSLTCDGSLK